jgi:hypothetical protein
MNTERKPYSFMARGETSNHKRIEFDGLAKAYRRLARQAEQNSLNDIVWEPPLKPSDTA